VLSHWQNKTVLVTGGHGFLGRHLCELLRGAGANVFAPRRVDHDLRDPEVAEGVFGHFEVMRQPVDVVYHLAANVGGIGVTKAHPAKTFYDNLTMGVNVIDAARLFNARRVIVAGSVCAYPLHTPVPMVEDNLWEGEPEPTNGPYGVAKRALLTMLQAYAAEYGMDGVYLLFANMYGPGDNFDPKTSHVIPALIRKCTTARDTGAPNVDVWGSGRASRDFLYVEDAVQALAAAGEAPRADKVEPINIGSGVETPIYSLVEIIRRATGYEGGIVYDASKPDGQPRRRLDIHRAKERMGWSPLMKLEEGIQATVEWWEGTYK
jgi:nucleoside-diphosphate-sugar epimerase